MYWVFQWHFAMYTPVVVLGAAALFSLLSRGFPFAWLRYAMLLGVLLFTTGSLAAYVWVKGGQHCQRLAAARWAQANTPEDALFAIMDAGAFAYFSNRRTINLDGIINGYAYQEHLVVGTLDEYFESVGLDYLADAFVLPSDRQLKKSLLGRLDTNGTSRVGYRFAVTPEAEVYCGPSRIFRRLRRHPITFVIWRYSDIRMERLQYTGGG